MIEQISQLIENKNSKSFHKILSQHPHLLDWMQQETAAYAPKNINEQLYILLKSPPHINTCGKYPVFSSYEKGYRQYCGSRKSCMCINQDHSKQMLKYNQSRSQEEKTRIQAKTRLTNLEKYGVDNVAKNDQIKAKIHQTNLKKYGTKTPLESQHIQNKIKKTNICKYGVQQHSLKELSELLSVSESVIWNRHNRYQLDFYSKNLAASTKKK
jgi:hypothetical protein